MSDQNPFGAPPPPAQPYGATPPPAFGAPQEPWATVPLQPGVQAYDGYPGFPGQQPKQSRKALWIVLGCVSGAVLLGAGLLGYFIYDTASNTGNNKVALPETFQGLNQDPGNSLAQKLQSSLQDGFSKGKNAWTPTAVSALYKGDSSGTGAGSVLIAFGGYGNVLAPSVQADDFLNGFEQGAAGQGTTFTGRASFDPGPLGGTLKCELMKAESETDSLCVWADGSSVVGVMAGKADTTDAPDLTQASATARELRQIAEVPK